MTQRISKSIQLILLFALVAISCNFLALKPRDSAAQPTATIRTTATIEQPTPLPAQPLKTVQPTQSPEPESMATLEISGISFGQIAYRHVQTLSVEIGPRVAGGNAEAQAAGYIQEMLEDIGYEVERMGFTFEDEDGDWSSANIIAVKPGLSGQEIIVGAHYDSVEMGAGADDNASGVGALLEAAECVWDQETNYTIRFIAFGAEEVDLDGSRRYARRMTQAEIKNTVAYFNLDSLIAGDYTYMYGDTGPGSLHEWIMNLAQTEGFDLRGKKASDLDEEDGTPCNCADYGPFQAIGIPFVYFEATNWEVGDKDGWTQVDPRRIPGGKPADGVIWHTKFDDLQRLEQLFPGRAEAHLKVFVTLLVKTLLQFR